MQIVLLAVAGLAFGIAVYWYRQASLGPIVIDLEAVRHDTDFVSGRNVVVRNAVCVFSELTWMPAVSPETGSATCFYPAVSRSTWDELLASHGEATPFPTTDQGKVRLLIQRSCAEVERSHGSYTGPRPIPPENCELRGQIRQWHDLLSDGVRNHLRHQYPRVRKGVLLDPKWETGYGGAGVMLALGLFALAGAVFWIREVRKMRGR